MRHTTSQTEEAFENDMDDDVKDGWTGYHELEVDPEFESLMPPLSAEEDAALDESIAAQGCLDPIKVWGNIIVDGHNRHKKCQKHSIAFPIKKMYFEDRAEAMRWMYTHQRARRNWTPERERYVRGKVFLERVKSTDTVSVNKEAESLAQESAVTSRTIYRDAAFAQSLDDIKEDAPDIHDGVLSGEMKVPAKRLKALAEAPPEERRQANASAKGVASTPRPRKQIPLAPKEAINHVVLEIGKAMRAIDALHAQFPNESLQTDALGSLRDATDTVKQWRTES